MHGRSRVIPYAIDTPAIDSFTNAWTLTVPIPIPYAINTAILNNNKKTTWYLQLHECMDTDRAGTDVKVFVIGHSASHTGQVSGGFSVVMMNASIDIIILQFFISTCSQSLYRVLVLCMAILMYHNIP